MVPPHYKGYKKLKQYTASHPASVDHWCHLDQDILLAKPYHRPNKGVFNRPNSSLTFPKAEDCSMVNQNFASFKG